MESLLLPNDTNHPPRMYKITQHLYAGFYPGDLDPNEERKKLSWLLEEGVTIFINLTEPSEYAPNGQKLKNYSSSLDTLAREREITDIQVLSFPIRDVSVPDREQMVQILDTIDFHLAAGRKVYIHCLGGRGRTGTVVGCWLVRHGYGEGQQVLKALELRSKAASISYPCPESEEQRSFVRGWRPQM